jgi:hypothetical protein
VKGVELVNLESSAILVAPSLLTMADKGLSRNAIFEPYMAAPGESAYIHLDRFAHIVVQEVLA